MYSVTAQETFVGFDEPVGTNPPWEAVYRYDAYLLDNNNDPDPFDEQAGVEYFMEIDKPQAAGENFVWGWHFTPNHFLDWAADSNSGLNGPWTSLAGTDLAFELMTDQGGPSIPEPSALVLVILGAATLLGLGRRGPK